MLAGCKGKSAYAPVINSFVEKFVGRAVLLHKGRVVGDVSTLELEEQGRTLMGYIKPSEYSPLPDTGPG